MMVQQKSTMFVVQLACPRDLTVIRFALFAEDFGPGYGLVANMELKQSVFKEFVRRLGADVRDDPSPMRRWQWPQHRIKSEIANSAQEATDERAI